MFSLVRDNLKRNSLQSWAQKCMLESLHSRGKIYSTAGLIWVAFTAFAFKTANLCTFGLIRAFPLFSFSVAYVENGCHLVKLSTCVILFNFLRIALPYFPLANLIIFAMLSFMCLYCRFKRTFVLTYFLKFINFSTFLYWNYLKCIHWNR